MSSNYGPESVPLPFLPHPQSETALLSILNVKVIKTMSKFRRLFVPVLSVPVLRMSALRRLLLVLVLQIPISQCTLALYLMASETN